MNIEKLLEVGSEVNENVKLLRILIQGTGGTGKIFVITAVSQSGESSKEMVPL